MTRSISTRQNVQPQAQQPINVNHKSRNIQGQAAKEIARNGGSKQLSKLAAGNSKPKRKRRVHYSSKKRVRAAAFFAGLLGLGGRQTKGGRLFRKLSPFISAGLVIAGVVATATGLGAVVGVPLIIAGSALGCANSTRNMLDLYVEHNMRKENGEQGVKHYKTKMAANAVGLLLSAAPGIGAAGQMLSAASGIAGTIGSALAPAAPGALAQGASMASAGLAGAMSMSGIAQGIKEVVDPEFEKRDRAETEIRVRSDNPDFSYTDPISGRETKKVADFVDSVSSKAQAVSMTAPDNTAPISSSPTYFRSLLNDMHQKSIFNVAHLQMVNELMDADRKDLCTPPGREPGPGESPQLWQLKQDVKAASLDTDGNFNPEYYKKLMGQYKNVATDFWSDHEEECDAANNIMQNMTSPIKSRRTLKGTFVDPSDGAHVGIALDFTGGRETVVVTAPGIADGGFSSKDDRTGLYRMGLEMKNQFAGRGRDNFNSFAAFAADVKQASSGMFAGDNFAVAGLCQGGGKAAFASAKLDVPGYTFDARPLGSGTVDHLITKDCDWKEVQARWKKNLVTVMSADDPISNGRGLRGGAIGNQVSYPSNYIMDVPSKRDASVSKMISSRAGAGHHVSSYKDVLHKCWHEGDKQRRRGDKQNLYRGNNLNHDDMRFESIDESVDDSMNGSIDEPNVDQILDVIHD